MLSVLSSILSSGEGSKHCVCVCVCVCVYVCVCVCDAPNFAYVYYTILIDPETLCIGMHIPMPSQAHKLGMRIHWPQEHAHAHEI